MQSITHQWIATQYLDLVNLLTDLDASVLPRSLCSELASLQVVPEAWVWVESSSARMRCLLITASYSDPNQTIV